MNYEEKNIEWLKDHLGHLKDVYRGWEHLPLMGQNIKSRIDMVENLIKSKTAQ